MLSCHFISQEPRKCRRSAALGPLAHFIMRKIGFFPKSEYIQKNPSSITLEDVAVSDFFKGFSSINESNVDSVDISKPVILAEISPGRYNLIDGNHRMEKARRMGINSIRAYKLNVEQHIRFLTSKKSLCSLH